jgi:hypothetical protein
MMATTEERMKILRMIEEGKLTAEEGAKLLSALSESRARVTTGNSLGRTAGAARWLRVRVTDVATGRSKATVQIPIGLLEAGMKIGAHFARSGRRGYDPAHGRPAQRDDRQNRGRD